MVPWIAGFLDGPMDRQILIYSATAAALVVGAIGLSSWSKSNNSSIAPPRVRGWPMVGSALEFGADCRAFLRRHFDRLQTPIFTANIAGKDYHFVDTSYAEFTPEKLFRSPELHFRPMANDAMVFGFGVAPGLLERINGPDGNSKDVNAIYHSHLMKPEGLAELLHQAQRRLDETVFADDALYPTGTATFTKPLYRLVRESLFPATIGAVLSESIVADPSVSLRQFEALDRRFPLLLAKVPFWMFPQALWGRDGLRDRCRGPAFDRGLSSMIRRRNELVRETLDIHSPDEIAYLSVPLIWAAAANALPTGFWLIHHLLQDREGGHAAIRAEIAEIRPHQSPWTLAELDRLVRLDSALTETLRIHSESMIARDVMEDFELDLQISGSSKYRLEKNSRVAVMMSRLHMDESVFADAHAFRWDRFSPGPDGKAPVFAKNGRILATPVRPFGGGISMCPGRKFASYEIKAFVAELLHRYDLELVDRDGDKKLRTDPSRAGLGINVPLDDVDVRITRRCVE